MARITGTRSDDRLDGDFGDIADRVLGFAGDDVIYGYGGHDDLRGGRGNDLIEAYSSSGRWLGGQGDDLLYNFGGQATIIGGSGDDVLHSSGGALYGDEQPGLPARAIGNDRLVTHMTEAGVSSQTGGLGVDAFIVRMFAEGIATEVDVKDFRPGIDKVGLSLLYTDGNGLRPADLFGVLSGGDGVIDNYSQADGNAEVWSDVEGNRLVIRVHEDYVVLEGVTQLAAADFIF